MICLDTWVWLEYLFTGEQWQAAKRAIQTANAPGSGGIVPATVVTEVSYQIRRQMDVETAEAAIEAIRSFDHIEILPITDHIAEYAAALRDKYDHRGDCELSYADAIHLAMAAAVSECETLYTGDPDFEAVTEIQTIVL